VTPFISGNDVDTQWILLDQTSYIGRLGHVYNYSPKSCS